MFTHPAVSKTLLFGIATSLIIATLTGIIMDRITGDGGIWEEVHEVIDVLAIANALRMP